MPFVSSRSFTPYGMPCSGPRYLPAAISASAAFARASAWSRVSVMTERIFGSSRSMRAQIDLRQPLGRQLAATRSIATAASPARTRSRRLSTAAARRRPSSARIDRATAAPAMPGSIGFQSVAGASVSAIATFRGPVRRSRYGASDRRHESAACCRSAGVIVTCISFSASANVAGVTAGPEPAPVPNVGGAPGVGWRRWRGRRWRRFAAAGRRRDEQAERRADEELAASVHALTTGRREPGPLPRRRSRRPATAAGSRRRSRAAARSA